MIQIGPNIWKKMKYSFTPKEQQKIIKAVNFKTVSRLGFEISENELGVDLRKKLMHTIRNFTQDA
jgi:hypothetical protein